MWIQVAAGLALAVVLFSLFRYAMALRWSKVARVSLREAEELRGRRVVAEIPGAGDEMIFFLEDDEAFAWGAERVRKSEIVGARLRLNRGILASWARPGLAMPEPESAEDFEGRETWDVVLYLEGGATRVVPCGTLREGVSREIAARVFHVVVNKQGGAASHPPDPPSEAPQ